MSQRTIIDASTTGGLLHALGSTFWITSSHNGKQQMKIPPDLNARVRQLEDQFKHVPAPVLGLFAMLPKPDEEFRAEDRASFLRALAAVCDVVYGEDVCISIEAEARTL